MSGAGFVRFVICLVLVAFYWVFLAPVIDTVMLLEPMGQIVSQQRLDTLTYLVNGIKIAPLMFVLAYGITLWVTALNRSNNTVSAATGVKMVVLTYSSLLVLLLLCVAVGPLIDTTLYTMYGLPAIQNSVMEMSNFYVVLGWFYPFLLILMIGIYAAIFIAAVRAVDYIQRTSFW